MHRLCSAALAVTLAACASAPTPVLTDADYGPFPDKHQQFVREYFDVVLKDPMSAQYRFAEPRKGFSRKPPIMGGGLKEAGWFVDVDVNAKNSYGGYTGWQAYQFLFKDGEIIDRFGPIPGSRVVTPAAGK